MALRPKGPTVWFVSPALATIVFFVAHLSLSAWTEVPTDQVAGLSPQTPGLPLRGRIQAPIAPVARERRTVVRTVPKSEEDLLEMLERHEAVIFQP